MSSGAGILVPEKCSERIVALELEVHQLHGALLSLTETLSQCKSNVSVLPTRAEFDAVWNDLHRKADAESVPTKDDVSAFRAELSSFNTSFASLTDVVTRKADAMAVPTKEQMAAEVTSMTTQFEALKFSCAQSNDSAFAQIQAVNDGLLAKVNSIGDVMNLKADADVVPTKQQFASFKEIVLTTVAQDRDSSRAQAAEVREHLVVLDRAIHSKAEALAANTKAELSVLKESVDQRLDGQAVHAKAELAALKESVDQKLDGHESHNKAELTALLDSFDQRLDGQEAHAKAELAALQATFGQRLDGQQEHINVMSKGLEEQFAALECALDKKADSSTVSDTLGRKADIDSVPSRGDFDSLSDSVLQSSLQTAGISAQLQNLQAVTMTKANADAVATLEQLSEFDVRIRKQIDASVSGFKDQLQVKADAVAVPTKDELDACVARFNEQLQVKADAATVSSKEELDAFVARFNEQLQGKAEVFTVPSKEELDAFVASFTGKLNVKADAIAVPSKDELKSISDKVALNFVQAETNKIAMANLRQELLALEKTADGKANGAEVPTKKEVEAMSAALYQRVDSDRENMLDKMVALTEKLEQKLDGESVSAMLSRRGEEDRRDMENSVRVMCKQAETFAHNVKKQLDAFSSAMRSKVDQDALPSRKQFEDLEASVRQLLEEDQAAPSLVPRIKRRRAAASAETGSGPRGNEGTNATGPAHTRKLF